MRPPTAKGTATMAISFNLRREAAPHATPVSTRQGGGGVMFQSQTRSRSTCDDLRTQGSILLPEVSISDEKPLHMRRRALDALAHGINGFNLRREAAPHATRSYS